MTDVKRGEDNNAFSDLGVCSSLCKCISMLGWSEPTDIQRNVIPHALSGRDIIGLAETGSGKTGAFAIPILDSLLCNPQRLMTVILVPTRELAFQIKEVFDALGGHISLDTACIIGGIDMISQAIILAKKPHIIVGTPGEDY